MSRAFGRLWEVDAARGAAIVMMLISNFVFDLSFFRIVDVDIYSGFWWAFARATASMFVLLVGLSLTLSYANARKEKKYRSEAQLWQKFAARGAKIFGLGMLITAATWIFLRGEGSILFGVLHLIGLSIIVAKPFLRLRLPNLVFGATLIALGIYLSSLHLEFSAFFWLVPSYFYTIDSFPMLPWFGVVLVGIFLGNTLYPRRKRALHFPDLSAKSPIKALGFLGRNSLKIYLLHQPVIVGLLYIFALR